MPTMVNVDGRLATERDAVVSVFGTFFEGMATDAVPGIGAATARAAALAKAGKDAVVLGEPELLRRQIRHCRTYLELLFGPR